MLTSLRRMLQCFRHCFFRQVASVTVHTKPSRTLDGLLFRCFAQVLYEDELDWFSGEGVGDVV